MTRLKFDFVIEDLCSIKSLAITACLASDNKEELGSISKVAVRFKGMKNIRLFPRFVAKIVIWQLLITMMKVQ